MACLYNSLIIIILHHQSSYQSQNRVELWKSGVNQGVGEHVVSLAHTHDTVGANLSLTHGRNHADQAHAEANAEDYQTLCRVGFHLA